MIVKDLYSPADKKTKIKSAIDAVEIMGGLTKCATKLTLLTNVPVTKTRVMNWTNRGIPAEWIPTMHMLSNIPCHEFDPIAYPKWLFNE